MRVACPTHLNHRKAQISAAAVSHAPSSPIQALCHVKLCGLENNSERFGEAWCLRRPRHYLPVDLHNATCTSLTIALHTTSLPLTLQFATNVRSTIFDTPETCLSLLFSAFISFLCPSVNGRLLCLIYFSRFSWFHGFVQEYACLPADVLHLAMLSNAKFTCMKYGYRALAKLYWQWKREIQGGSNMTGTDCGLFTHK